MQSDTGYEGDPRYYRDPTQPLITPERARKGDVFTGPDCGDCGGTGKDKMTEMPCKACRGRGWVGSINAATVENEHIRYAQVHEVNLLNKLWNCEHISDQQHHDGQTFQIWRDMHRAQMGLEKPVSSGGDQMLGVRLRAYGYILIIRRLSRYDSDAIDTSLKRMLMSWAEWIARNRMEKYVRALERLSRAITPRQGADRVSGGPAGG
jgi:hypothetical protein